MNTKSDILVVGAGIVGLATALELQRRMSDLTVTVVETESTVGAHQSGHNSGVLHSGIYYKPGSQKAIACRSGKQAMEAFCDEHGIAWDRCGKVVVATDSTELTRLERIEERASANGVSFERIDTDGLRDIEPAAAGIAALHVPESGIVNYRDVCGVMAKLIVAQGGEVRKEFKVSQIDPRGGALEVRDARGSVLGCGHLVNCAGLQCDRVCRLAGGEPDVRIVPFRGEYYELAPHRESLCRNLIYPVPDPSFPFLGVHFTRMIDGGVECGPNAVLALARQGYRWSDFSLADLASSLTFPGFQKLALKHWRAGAGEIHRSLSKRAFVAALRKLIPEIAVDDLVPGRSGVRAQAVTREGDLFDDFLIEETASAIHVLNAPSPAATASLAIATMVVDRFAASLR